MGAVLDVSTTVDVYTFFRTWVNCYIITKIYTRTNLQTILAQWPENKWPCTGFFNGDGRFCNFLRDKKLREIDLKKIQVND